MHVRVRVCINTEEIAFPCLTEHVYMVYVVSSMHILVGLCMHVCGIADIIRTHAYMTYSNRCNNIMLPTCKWVST